MPANTLQLSPEDIQLLAALAQAEGGGPEIADVVLNRMASPLYGDTVADVVGQKAQFEPVTKYGGVDKLPPASDDKLAEIRDYLASVAQGGKRAAEKATHFLNPLYSGSKARNTWAKDYMSWPSFGEGKKKQFFGSLVDVPDYSVSLADGGPEALANMASPEQGLLSGLTSGDFAPAGNAGSMADLGAIGDAGGLAASIAGTGVPWADIAMMAAGMLGQMGQPDPASQQAQEVSQRAAEDATQQRQQYAARNGWGWG
jgi:hypothetical protein